MSKPYVSIIVPIYNGQDYVKDLVTSIVNQQTKEMELIIVDDGSIDHTLEYCMELKEKYAWVNVIHTENKGVSHARNVGLENAHGKWIHFVDADDQLSEGMYDAFMQKINQTFPDVMVCGCNRVYTGTNESTICGPIEDAVIEKEGISEFFKQVDMERRFWLLDYIWNKWYRRDLIERYHIRFNESLSLGEDFVFNTQYFQHVTKMALSSEHFYQYLIRENGLVSKFREKPWEGREQLYRAHRELYQSMNLLESMEKQIQIQAGQIAFGDVKTINSPKCFYDRNEKIEFVRGMLHSSQYEWILTYLKNKGERSILYKGYDWMFSKGRASLIADIFWIEKKVREFLEI